jgi:hypothetical protein
MKSTFNNANTGGVLASVAVIPTCSTEWPVHVMEWPVHV